MYLLKTSTKICFDITSKENVRSKNSKTLSVIGQDIVNFVLQDEAIGFIKLKKLSKSSLKCFHKTNLSSQRHLQHFAADS